jgi:hypothetical protein
MPSHHRLMTEWSPERFLDWARRYGDTRLEAACERADRYRIGRYKAIKNILDRGLDRDMHDTQTLALLRRLRLSAMANVYEASLRLGTSRSRDPDELISSMAEAEWNARTHRSRKDLSCMRLRT